MARVIQARRVALSQKIIVYLVILNLILVIAYFSLAGGLRLPAAVVIPALLVFYNMLLSWLVIRRSRRLGDRPMLYTMVFSVLLLSVGLLTKLFG
ncbi:hypothetical protein [Marinobacter xestospongiae]|uniref:hypothetical protein n=1 Tax=Marinobacter xestospongiae TaxID=994319 RepID=UPI002003D2BA|nr:hypothetical protein [Marinobacter xestospongiae]MCK7567372.1 hypothetical protein [Marinobacter xestospongiae]